MRGDGKTFRGELMVGQGGRLSLDQGDGEAPTLIDELIEEWVAESGCRGWLDLTIESMYAVHREHEPRHLGAGLARVVNQAEWDRYQDWLRAQSRSKASSGER